MRSILSACVVLVGLIAWKVINICQLPVPHSLIVEDEWRDAYAKALSARKQIQEVEERTGAAEVPAMLKPEDLARIEGGLKELQAAERRFQALETLLRKKKLEDCNEMRDLLPCWRRTKVWILDAADLVGPPPKPPESAGLYIRMNRALHRSEKVKEELSNLRKAAGEIQDRNDPVELEEARKQARKIRETLGECRTELSGLEDFLRRELKETDLSARDLPDLETLRGEATLLQQAMISAGEISLRFRR
jgi:hypothetical protein